MIKMWEIFGTPGKDITFRICEKKKSYQDKEIFSTKSYKGHFHYKREGHLSMKSLESTE